MKLSLSFLLFIIFTSLSFGDSSFIKLGEIPRSSDLDKESMRLIPQTPKDWQDLSNDLLGPNKVVTAKNKKYSIESGVEDPNGGDLARYVFQLTKDGKKTLLSDGPLAWVQVSPDEQYIFYEPFTVINTQKWSKQHLQKLIGDSGYFKILKYSASTKRVIVVGFDCTMDCPKTDKFILWQISLEKP